MVIYCTRDNWLRVKPKTIVSSAIMPINHQQTGRYWIYTMDVFDVLKNTPLIG